MRVAVALSGGMDSLRTAVLLRDQGHQVFGLHLRLFPPLGQNDPAADRLAARQQERLGLLAARLGLEVETLDLRAPFHDLVIRPFIEAYRRGLTPNPCVLCNPTIKFGLLLREALRRGADRFATGHYARITPPPPGQSRHRLLRGVDPTKDQSYFLYRLNQEQLAASLLPLGDSTKEASRRWLAATGLESLIPNESQEICFIPDGRYGDFVSAHGGGPSPQGQEGPIVDRSGREIGRHRGLFHYTVGQRRGLGIPSTEPYYVIALEPEGNRVRVGRAADLNVQQCRVEQVHWVSIDPPDQVIRAEVRIRNQHRPAAARIEAADRSAVRVRFESPQRAVTPGQAAVFYHGDVLLGGGTIAGPEC